MFFLSLFCRSKFGEYDEYHSSKDNFDVVTEEGLAGSFRVMKSIIRALEFGIYPRINVFCEPQMGKRGLYPNLSENKTVKEVKLFMDFISLCDGENSLLNIAEKINTQIIIKFR